MLLFVQLFFIINLSHPIMATTYQTQKYEIVKTYEDAELRYYPPVMKIQSNGAFGPLFQYISGANESQQKIEMTTPVYQSTTDGKPIMEFVLPERFDSQNTPNASSKNVRIFESKPGYFLAIRFSGYATQNRKEEQTRRLQKLADNYQLKMIGAPLLLVYNSPYRIFNRTNELLIEIDF
jgi:hypothetical protein